MDLSRFEVLTFDCYGTLIDWELGILSTLQPLLRRYDKQLCDEKVLSIYARLEQRAEDGDYRPYHEILQQVVQDFGTELGFTPTATETKCLSRSIIDWPPFPDTVQGLKRLKERYRLGILSNIDEDLFKGTSRHLGVSFDWVITAEQVRSYKPNEGHFIRALETFGLPKERILHVAQSLFHDIAPAKRLGLSTVWVNRRHGKTGSGATPPARSISDLEVPDLETFVRMVEMK